MLLLLMEEHSVARGGEERGEGEYEGGEGQGREGLSGGVGESQSHALPLAATLRH